MLLETKCEHYNFVLISILLSLIFKIFGPNILESYKQFCENSTSIMISFKRSNPSRGVFFLLFQQITYYKIFFQNSQISEI